MVLAGFEVNRQQTLDIGRFGKYNEEINRKLIVLVVYRDIKRLE